MGGGDGGAAAGAALPAEDAADAADGGGGRARAGERRALARGAGGGGGDPEGGGPLAGVERRGPGAPGDPRQRAAGVRRERLRRLPEVRAADPRAVRHVPLVGRPAEAVPADLPG